MVSALASMWRATALLSVLIACEAAQSPVRIIDATFKYKEFDVVRNKKTVILRLFNLCANAAADFFSDRNKDNFYGSMRHKFAFWSVKFSDDIFVKEPGMPPKPLTVSALCGLCGLCRALSLWQFLKIPTHDMRTERSTLPI
jgi:hypothetical protein